MPSKPGGKAKQNRRRVSMSSRVAGNAWADIIHHQSDGILELRWLPGSMTDAPFKATLALLVWQAETLRPRFVLIDAKQFRPKFESDMTQWRDDCIIPRYGAAGVTKFAFVMPDGFPDTVENGAKETIDGPAIFPTARFAQRDNALAWFRKS
jgi:hypothetical protein